MAIPQHICGIDVTILIPYVCLVIVIGFILSLVPGLIWIERVVMGLMQDRHGPNRVGPFGLLQPIADGLKLFFKEDIRPNNVSTFMFFLAPVLAILPPLAAGATIPFSRISVRMDDGTIRDLPMIVGHVNIGILFVLALASIQVYGIILGGWASNNKYSLLGGLRASAQVISYELSMSMAILTAVLMSHSLDLVQVVDSQAGFTMGLIPRWHIFQFYGLGAVAAVIYLVSMVAETNRAPFDLPEAESELIAGFHTEYSSMKFAIFFMGEYASMVVVASIATVLWLGGWHAPLPMLDMMVPGFVWFIGKVMVLIFTYVWIRATLPRLRYDALMSLGWKRLLPVALFVLFAVAAVDTFTTPQGPSHISPIKALEQRAP